MSLLNLSRGIRLIFPPFIPLIFFMSLAEVAVRAGWVHEYILPAPSMVLSALATDRTELLSAFTSTALASSLGLAMSFIVGVSAAILLSFSDWLRRAILPYAIFFQTVPIISIAPLLVIWFGFGIPTVVVSAFIVSIFPIVASTLLGLRSTEPALVDLFKLYEASRWNQMWKLRLPYAAPQIFSGLRIASGLAVIGAIVGEFIAGSGLGSVIDDARTQQRIDKVFAAILIASLLGLVLVGIVNFTSWLALRRWHASAQNG